MPMMPVRDTSLFVKLVGDGYPLVLMHGGPGLDHTTLSSLEPLADEFTLIFYDHRANGRSSGATESMTWDNLTADADAIRDTFGYEDWAVLGHSFGGQVALKYALRYPDRVSRLILLDTSGAANGYHLDAPGILRKRGYSADAVHAVERFFTGNLKVDEVRSTVMKFMKAYFYKFRLWDLPRAFYHERNLKFRPEPIVYAFSKLIKDWSVMDQLWQIDIPTLVMGGRFDFLFPPEHLAILADRLPCARLEIIENTGHNPHMEKPDEVLRILRGFLNSVTASFVSEQRPAHV